MEGGIYSGADKIYSGAGAPLGHRLHADLDFFDRIVISSRQSRATERISISLYQHLYSIAHSHATITIYSVVAAFGAQPQLRFLVTPLRLGIRYGCSTCLQRRPSQPPGDRLIDS